MDSSRSSMEKSQTRFSTPVSDLDDHRNQPVSIPRADTQSSANKPGTRRNTAQSVFNGGKPDLLQVNDALRDPGPISRDFEHAVVDDDHSGQGEHCIEHAPVSPALGRHGTRRYHNRSRDSSTSSRASSAANSVEAFADPRRRERANTAASTRPSDLDLGVQRTTSGGTHHRRPSFGSVRHLDTHDDRASYHNLVEEDVCFPQPEESNGYRIDFEELEELAADLGKVKSPISGHGDKRFSFSSQSKPHIFSDLRKQAEIPKIFTSDGEPVCLNSESVIDDSKSVIDEKHDPIPELCGDLHHPSVAEPSRFSFFSSELEQTIHASSFPDLLGPGEGFRDLFSMPIEGGVWWLDVLNPTHDEIDGFRRASASIPLPLKTSIPKKRAKKSNYSSNYMEPLNVYMVVFREGILTFTYSPSPHASNVRKRIGKLRDYMALTADWICYAMIDNIVDSYGPPIASIEAETDTIEDQVFVARTDDFTPLLRQIGECRKKVMSLMRLLGGKADVIKGFAKRCNESYSVTPRGEIGLYLGDIQDHVVTMMSNLGHFEKMLSRSHSNYLAQLSVDNIAQGNRANEVLSKITLLATILVPLNLITGMFGMNVPVPGKDSSGLGWFFGIIGVIAVIVATSLAVARRYKFI